MISSLILAYAAVFAFRGSRGRGSGEGNGSGLLSSLASLASESLSTS